MNPNMKKSFNVFLEGVCKMYSIPDEAKKLLQEGVEALEEAHFDRTTGGNFFGKTIRDQNEYDNKYNLLGEGEPTKTAGITDDRYGFPKNGVKGMGMSGKFGNAYDLHDDGRHTTGTNSGIAATGRREMKRKENEFWDNEIENELSDLDDDELMDITYEPMSKTQLRGVDPSVFDEPTGNTLSDFDSDGKMASAASNPTYSQKVRQLTEKVNSKLNNLYDVAQNLQWKFKTNPALKDLYDKAIYVVQGWTRDVNQTNLDSINAYLNELTETTKLVERALYYPEGITPEDTAANFESVNYTGTELGGQGASDPRKKAIMAAVNRVATEGKLPHTKQFKITGGRTINITFALNDITVTLDDGTEVARITQASWCQYSQQRKLAIGKVADVIIELADKLKNEQAAQ